MRTAISFLVTTAVLSSFAFNFLCVENVAFDFPQSELNSEQLLLARSETKPKNPYHRGSGRREAIQSWNNLATTV